MTRPDRHFDWQELQTDDGPATVGTRERLRGVLLGFVACLAMILFRAVQLEISAGPTHRELAQQPLTKTRPLAASRGRILSRDGVVLAADEGVSVLAMHYRHLESPANRTWLRTTARARLSKADRRQPERVASAEQEVLREREILRVKLAALAGIDGDELNRRAAAVQTRVETLAARVNERRLAKFETQAAAEFAADIDVPLWRRLGNILSDAFTGDDSLPPAPIVVAEQTTYHVLVDRLLPEVAEEIRNAPASFPGVKILEQTRRAYPHGELAAHVIGHVGNPADSAQADDDSSGVGLMGIERSFESQLAARPGEEIQETDRRGKVIASQPARPPQDGDDVRLTLDLALQRSIEEYLDEACSDATQRDEEHPRPLGGAAIVMDVRSGALLATASSPRFNPRAFVDRDNSAITGYLNDARHPLLDRAVKMALPPGSVFKPLTAIALLECGAIRADEPFECQGYLHHPDRERCFIFRRYGVGHGEVMLADALAQSCNVFFYHHATATGCAPLIHWAERFGFGRQCGVDLPDESSGRLPTPDVLRDQQDRTWRVTDTQALAIGQSSLTVTPLQIVRMMAAIGNGGELVAPHVVQRDDPGTTSHKIADLDPQVLADVREGLRRVVAHPNGTGHATFSSARVNVAGKTGTAETGAGRPDHAWFAGYVPAESPQFAFVVVLEHAGGGAAVAAPLARRVIDRLRELGYFGPIDVAQSEFPPGKG